MARGNDLTEFQCDFCGTQTQTGSRTIPVGWCQVQPNDLRYMGTWHLCKSCWDGEGVDLQVAMDRQMEVWKQASEPDTPYTVGDIERMKRVLEAGGYTITGATT